MDPGPALSALGFISPSVKWSLDWYSCAPCDSVAEQPLALCDLRDMSLYLSEPKFPVCKVRRLKQMIPKVSSRGYGVVAPHSTPSAKRKKGTWMV